METVLNNNLRLTFHGFNRGKQRNIYPEWMHFSTANKFIVQMINRTQDKQINEYGSLIKIILPGVGIKAYVRNNKDIVTLVKRRRKVG